MMGANVETKKEQLGHLLLQSMPLSGFPPMAFQGAMSQMSCQGFLVLLHAEGKQNCCISEIAQHIPSEM